MTVTTNPMPQISQSYRFGDCLTDELECDMIGGVREVPLRSIAPGQRFELVLSATTPYPHKRWSGTVIRHGPGTSAVILDHAEKERHFTTKEGTTVVLHKSGGIQYWSPGTAVLKIAGERDITRWTTQGGTGVGLAPDAESQDELTRRTEMSEERVATLPGTGNGTKTKAAKKGKAAKVAKAKTPKAPKVAKPLNDCMCGCGDKVTGNFRQGHDARYYSILKKLNKGEMAFNSIPKLMQNALGNLAGAKKALASSKHAH